MNNKTNDRGSIWRIWDLHVHSPASYSGSYTEFINNAKTSEASVIGINDYCTIKGYEEINRLGGIPNKIIFPVVELRSQNLLVTKHKKNGLRVNFHIIFNNDEHIFPTVSNWLNSLKCFDEKGNPIQLGIATELTKLSFDINDVVNSLKYFNLYEEHALIWLPYDEYGGIDEINPIEDGYFKTALIKEAHIIGSSTDKQIKFFKWNDPKYTIEQYQQWFDKPKPCIKGSDSHNNVYPFGRLKNQKSEPIEKYCWINTDTTFRGLKQILVEPDRVFIGKEPELLKRVRENKTKFIKSLSIKKVNDANIDDVWFENFHLELNSALVAIIGNKGNGKSAVTDIIALCGNTYQPESYFSFLNKNKFRKLKPNNLSEKFEAKLTWVDGKYTTKRLNENPDKDSPERVRYIPQNFLETLCAEIESNKFEDELKQIIYSHTPNEKRLGLSSLDELINYKSELVNNQITHIKNDISKLNLEIVALEQKSSREHKKLIENTLRLKQSELAAHLGIKPLKPELVQSKESENLNKELAGMREEVNKLELQITEKTAEKSDLYKIAEDLKRAEQAYTFLDAQLDKRQEENDEFVQILTNSGINHRDVFSYFISINPIIEARTEVDRQIFVIELLLAKEEPDSAAFKLLKLQERILQKQEELDKPAKAQQKFFDELKNWEEQKQSIEGSMEIEGSLRFLEGQLIYLETKLSNELASKYDERNELLKQLFAQKIELVKIKEELYQPVSEFINKIKELKTKYDVQIEAMLEMRSFESQFITFINHGKSGTYYGRDDSYQRLLDLTEKTNLDNAEGLINFTSVLIENLKNDKRTSESIPIDVKSQLSKGKEPNELYDFIFHLDYIEPIYNLKLGNKTLLELSPGERGALLLIFYLILDNDDIPLIIDQPEDNLDNESIYNILVHFIKKVKGNRQIIIVTHNPNLAIVCDAEQIVHIQIEKENKNTVKFYSASIEDKLMNESIVNILEGTLPAFNNRDSKYVR